VTAPLFSLSRRNWNSKKKRSETAARAPFVQTIGFLKHLFCDIYTLYYIYIYINVVCVCTIYAKADRPAAVIFYLLCFDLFYTFYGGALLSYHQLIRSTERQPVTTTTNSASGI
jgi:hypothetical protein